MRCTRLPDGRNVTGTTWTAKKHKPWACTENRGMQRRKDKQWNLGKNRKKPGFAARTRPCGIWRQAALCFGKQQKEPAMPQKAARTSPLSLPAKGKVWHRQHPWTGRAARPWQPLPGNRRSSGTAIPRASKADPGESIKEDRAPHGLYRVGCQSRDWHGKKLPNGSPGIPGTGLVTGPNPQEGLQATGAAYSFSSKNAGQSKTVGFIRKSGFSFAAGAGFERPQAGGQPTKAETF